MEGHDQHGKRKSFILEIKVVIERVHHIGCRRGCVEEANIEEDRGGAKTILKKTRKYKPKGIKSTLKIDGEFGKKEA